VLWDAVTGLFTSVDPVPGGNTTDYVYPQDPINGFDLDGKAWRGGSRGAFIGPILNYLRKLVMKYVSKPGNLTRIGYSIGKAFGKATTGAKRIKSRFVRGGEIWINDNVRIAPKGNKSSSNKYARWPHYHRRAKPVDGKTPAGQGIGRHRPWEKSVHDKSWKDQS